MELKKYKKVVNKIIMIVILGAIVLIIISRLILFKEAEWIAEQFAVAISTRDLDLLDELMDPLCEMYTTDGKNRVYSHYQRGVIENLWSKETYVVTSYDSHLSHAYLGDIEVFLGLRNRVSYSIVMEIVDKDGMEYKLWTYLVIRKVGLFDAKIVGTKAQLLRHNPQ